MKLFKKFSILLLVLVLVLTLLPTAAMAEENIIEETPAEAAAEVEEEIVEVQAAEEPLEAEAAATNTITSWPANTHTQLLANDDTFTIVTTDSPTNPYTINVAAGASVKITGIPGVTYTNLKIVCAGSATIALDNINFVAPDDDAGIMGDFNAGSTLTINTIGPSSITGGKNFYGIDSIGSIIFNTSALLTVKGGISTSDLETHGINTGLMDVIINGKLHAIGGDGTTPGYGIYSAKNVEILEGAEVFARGGKDNDNAYGYGIQAFKEVYIKSGNIAKIDATPKKNSNNGILVNRGTITLNPAMEGAKLSVNVPAEYPVAAYTYTAKTDENGKAYIWLPVGKHTVKTSINGETFTGIVDITENDDAELTLNTTSFGELQNLRAVHPSIYVTDSYTLLWDKVDGAEAYNIYQDGEKIASVSTLSYAVSGLKAGIKNTYTVAAVINGTQADLSDPLSVFSRPSKPTGFAYTTKGVNTITMGWNSVPGANYYRVYRKIDGKFKHVDSVKGGGNTTYKFTGLNPGEKNYFKVVSICRVDGVSLRGDSANGKALTHKDITPAQNSRKQ